MESTSTSNSIHSTMVDLLDRCSSPPSIDHDVRSCLNDLCHRVVLSIDDPLLATSIVYNSIPSPVFKRKVDEQSSSSTTTTNKRSTKSTNQNDEQTPKKKRNRSSGKKAAIDVTTPVMKKEEPIEQEMPDIKPTLLSSTVMAPANPSEYVCEWENCRKYVINDFVIVLSYCFFFKSRSFPTARSVFHHACSAHIKHLPEYVCLWNGCDRIKRQKWALISHIQVDQFAIKHSSLSNLFNESI